MKYDMPTYNPEPILREVTLIVDESSFEALEKLANKAQANAIFSFTRIEVI